MTTPAHDTRPPLRDLGNFSVSIQGMIGLSCQHCNVSWVGCAAESCCPECGRPKGYHEHDRDECYCDECKPALWGVPA